MYNYTEYEINQKTKKFTHILKDNPYKKECEIAF